MKVQPFLHKCKKGCFFIMLQKILDIEDTFGFPKNNIYPPKYNVYAKKTTLTEIGLK